MNCQRHHDLLIERARGRVIEGYSERHHILPRCLGGTDDPENIVRLTPEEHYVVHQLLVKLHPEHRGLLGAAMMMASGSDKLSRRNKVYGWLRRRFSEKMTGSKQSPETVAKLAAINRTKTRSDEFKQGVARFHTGRKRSQATCDKISSGNKAKYRDPALRKAVSDRLKGIKLSDAHRENLRVSHLGKKASDATKKRMSEAARRKPPITDETRAKMKIAAALRWASKAEGSDAAQATAG